MKLRSFRLLWNLWPPYLGLGISVSHVSKDAKKVIVTLKKRPWNANYFGTQFGGGIFAMTDGIHVIMLLKLLPKGFHIWDKAANIKYLKRGLSNLTAEFTISDKDLNHILEQIKKHPSLDWEAHVDVKDKSGQVVAQVTRLLSIKKKK